MFFTQILKDNDAYYALHNTYFHSVFYIQENSSIIWFKLAKIFFTSNSQNRKDFWIHIRK